MKKFIISFLLLLWFFLLTGCSFNNILEKNKENSSQSTDQENMTISENDAIVLISELTEVKEWLDIFKKNKITESEPIIEVNSINEESYVIHAYESFPDYHATFWWYSINYTNGKITNELDPYENNTDEAGDDDYNTL